jgi:hypothetical protein
MALGIQLLNTRHDVARLRVDLAAKEAAFDVERAKAGKLLDDSNAAVKDLTQRVAELESGPSKDKTAAASSGGSVRDLIGGLLSSLKPSGGDEGQSSTGDDADNPMGAMAKMFQGESGKKMAEYGASIALDMAYRDLFSQLKLPKDVEDQVRGMFKGYMSEQITASMEMTQKGFNKEEADRLEKDGKARLKEQLATVLNADELAQWEEYESTIDERMLRQQFDMQLGMMAPGLTPENREVVRDALVEELLAMKETTRGITDMQHAIDGQLGAFDRTRDRLAESGQFDEAQLAEVDKYMNMMKQQVEMARAMFGGAAQQKPAQPKTTP